MRQRRMIGDFLSIELGEDTYAFGRVLVEPLVAFYDLQSDKILPMEDIASLRVLWRLMVMNHAITRGRWRIIGNLPLGEALNETPTFFKQDPITKQVSKYRNGVEWRADRDECIDLERAAVWDPKHVEDRLRDHFEGRPNKWVISLRLL